MSKWAVYAIVYTFFAAVLAFWTWQTFWSGHGNPPYDIISLAMLAAAIGVPHIIAKRQSKAVAG